MSHHTLPFGNCFDIYISTKVHQWLIASQSNTQLFVTSQTQSFADPLVLLRYPIATRTTHDCYHFNLIPWHNDATIIVRRRLFCYNFVLFGLYQRRREKPIR